MSTVVPDDLYSVLQQQMNNEMNVTAVMSSFASQPGYPLITVKLEKEGRIVHVNQTPFNTTQNGNDVKWNIPLSFASDNENSDFANTNTRIVLANDQQDIDIGHKVNWIVFNVQQTG